MTSDDPDSVFAALPSDVRRRLCLAAVVSR